MGKVKEAVYNWPPINCIENEKIEVSPQTPYINITPTTTHYPLNSLGGGGFIFNYPPLYTYTAMPPFVSTPVNKINSDFDGNNSPTSPVSSPYNGINGPLFPTDNNNNNNNNTQRKEKLQKYKQKRTKRNWNRPVDQGRRERAQARIRDEFGHFVPNNKRINCNNHPIIANLDENSQCSFDINQLELQLLMQQELLSLQHCSDSNIEINDNATINNENGVTVNSNNNNNMIHENRIHWSTVNMKDVFNSLNSNSFNVAFKEKIDFTSIELNVTESPYHTNYSNSTLNLLKLNDLNLASS